jgi:hypothetical protein
MPISLPSNSKARLAHWGGFDSRFLVLQRRNSSDGGKWIDARTIGTWITTGTPDELLSYNKRLVHFVCRSVLEHALEPSCSAVFEKRCR